MKNRRWQHQRKNEKGEMAAKIEKNNGMKKKIMAMAK